MNIVWTDPQPPLTPDRAYDWWRQWHWLRIWRYWSLGTVDAIRFRRRTYDD